MLENHHEQEANNEPIAKQRQGSFFFEELPPRIEIVEFTWQLAKPGPLEPVEVEPEELPEPKYAFEEKATGISEQAKALQQFFDDERKRRAA